MSKNKSKQDEIIKYYQEEFSNFSQDFPIDDKQLYALHKSIILNIKQQFNIETLHSNIQKSIKAEFSKISEQNEQIYLTLLTTYLDDEFDPINNNLVNNKYKSIDEYISDIKIFEEKVKDASN